MVVSIRRRNGNIVRCIGGVRVIDEKLKRDVADADIKAVRRDLLGIINFDPGLGSGEFKESLEYVEREMGAEKLYEDSKNLLEEFQYKYDPSEWTTEYDAKIYVALSECFSKELVDHLLKVAPVAYKEKRGQRKDPVQGVQILNQDGGVVPKKLEQGTGVNPVFLGICIIVAIIVVLVLII